MLPTTPTTPTNHLNRLSGTPHRPALSSRLPYPYPFPCAHPTSRSILWVALRLMRRFRYCLMMTSCRLAMHTALSTTD